MKSYEPRSSSSCAACKFLKRRCIPNCIFAPYFRANEPKKFAGVHKVFGASNVSKILMEVPEEQREDTVNSLAYEAEVRLKDPVYGCIGAIAMLQKKMVELQHDLAIARARLAQYNIATACTDSTSSPSSFNVVDANDMVAYFSCNEQVPAVASGGGFKLSHNAQDLSHGSMNIGQSSQAPYSSWRW